MVRLATIDDAEQLEIMNIEFNGEGNISLENIKKSILDNKQEIIIVNDNNGVVDGFVCVQMKKSFCYEVFVPEITEVFVREKFRRKGIAQNMIIFAEKYCTEHMNFNKLELLTGKANLIGQALYDKNGYKNYGQIHLVKKIEHKKSN